MTQVLLKLQRHVNLWAEYKCVPDAHFGDTLQKYMPCTGRQIPGKCMLPLFNLCLKNKFHSWLTASWLISKMSGHQIMVVIKNWKSQKKFIIYNEVKLQIKKKKERSCAYSTNHSGWVVFTFGFSITLQMLYWFSSIKIISWKLRASDFKIWIFTYS